MITASTISSITNIAPCGAVSPSNITPVENAKKRMRVEKIKKDNKTLAINEILPTSSSSSPEQSQKKDETEVLRVK